ncbi:hypothetical protein [Bradyrhizobium septentrionale]|uniref:Uncharacterized protein n=1 Tax=Bradyrhizobium septentrionale TaxID=1404411 RepID=A0A973W7L4_9BRAD|nr:hypothetical protein [Bradyrhizobium septentrionale]UGY17369.1 hypothetical protein HAP48_0008075 [Bradyrhizobium septentrionale]UGY26113.1 hypothetical protein HU675_0004795 [Bradyrhizobium septentrionale]
MDVDLGWGWLVILLGYLFDLRSNAGIVHMLQTVPRFFVDRNRAVFQLSRDSEFSDLSARAEQQGKSFDAPLLDLSPRFPHKRSGKRNSEIANDDTTASLRHLGAGARFARRLSGSR